jgi:hypothetical protein
MRLSYFDDVIHVGTFGRSRDDAVLALRQTNLLLREDQLHDHLNSGIKAMDVRRRVIIGIGGKSHPVERF